jgi:hypothetical protein
VPGPTPLLELIATTSAPQGGGTGTFTFNTPDLTLGTYMLISSLIRVSGSNVNPQLEYSYSGAAGPFVTNPTTRQSSQHLYGWNSGTVANANSTNLVRIGVNLGTNGNRTANRTLITLLPNQVITYAVGSYNFTGNVLNGSTTPILTDTVNAVRVTYPAGVLEGDLFLFKYV